MTSIGYSAFYNCTSLTSITIPDSVTQIGEGAFLGCTRLIETVNGVSYVGNILVYLDDSAVMVSIREGTRLMIDRACRDNKKVRIVTIPDSMESISFYAFEGCSSLMSITFGENSQLTDIDSNAFSGCSNLTSITIPDSVMSIGRYAFKGCSSMNSITIPFVGATKNGTANRHFGYIFGAYSDDYNEDDVPESLKTVIITGGATVAGSAFHGCSNLTNITLPDSVTSIGNYAFQGCSSLTSITIPDSVTSIDRAAFWQCKSLKSIEIPDSVTSIGDYAFYSCDSLTSVEIGDSVTSIGNYAFQWCSSLTNVVIGDSVTSIGDYTFSGCSSLTSITIPGSVTSIGYGAVSSCPRFASINFKGTKEQWNAISKHSWGFFTENYTVYCTDGNIQQIVPKE